MADITGNQTVRIRMPVGTAAEIDAAKKRGIFGFDTTAGTVAVCPADGANFVRLGLHPADAPAATSLGGTDLVLIVQGGVLKRTTVADISGGGVWQPLDSDLTAIAALTTTAFGRSFLTLANGPAALAAIGAASASDLAGYQPLDSDLTAIAALTTTSFGRSLLAMVDGPAVRAAIGAGTVVPGDLASYQPLDADLTAIAALATDAFGRGLLPLASAAAVRSYIGAGTSSFSGAYASLSSIPASIDAIDGLTPAADRIPYYTGASTGALATLTAFARTLLDDADSATARTTLGAAASTNPEFTGVLKQGGTLRITSDGGAWFASMQSTNLVGAGDRPVAADLTGTLQPKTPDQFRSIISALASSLKGAANGVAELGADGKVPSAQLPASTLPTDPVFDTVTTTGAAYIGTNLDVSGSAVVDGWASIAGSLQAADARFTNLSHALGGTATQLPGADEFGNLVASGLSTTTGSTGDFLVRKYRLRIGPLGAADYGVSTGGGLFVSSETETIAPILALGHGTEAIGVMADVRFAQVVAAGKTGVVPQLKAQTIVEAIGSGGTVGGYGARVTQRIRGDNANDLTDVLALESSLVTAKVPFRTDSACHHKTVIRTSTTTTAANNHIVIFDGMGDRTETLPAATGSGRTLVMKNRTGSFTWTLDASGSETIDGAATLVLTANQCATLIDYASGQWAVIGKVG